MNHNSVFSNLSDKDKIDFYIAITVIILTGVFILYCIYPSQYGNQKDENILIDNSLSIEQVEINNTVYVPVTKDILRRKRIVPVQEIKASKVPYNISSSKKAAPILENVEPNYSIQKDSSLITDKVLELKDTLSNTKLINDSIDKLDKDTIKTGVITPVTNTKTAEKVINENDENACIIIIGAYGKQRSIKNLVSRLEKERYNIFKAPYKSLTRIGIYLPCEKDLIESELVKLRKKYAKDAMLLRKEE